MFLFELLVGLYQLVIGLYQWQFEILGPLGEFLTNGGEDPAGASLAVAVFFGLIGCGTYSFYSVKDFCKKRGCRYRSYLLLFIITYITTFVIFVLVFPFFVASLIIALLLAIVWAIVLGCKALCRFFERIWDNPVINGNEAT